MQLRGWQEDAINQWTDLKKPAGILAVDTGLGKSQVAIELLKQYVGFYANAVIVILVPSVTLLEDWNLKLLEQGINPLLHGGSHKNNFGQINVATFATMRKFNLPKDGYRYFFIVDECHKIGSPANSQWYLKDMKPIASWQMGLTATVDRADGFNVEALIGPVFFEMKYNEGVEEGIVRPMYFTAIGYEMNPEEKAEYDFLTSRKKHIEKQLGVFSPSPIYMMQLKKEYLAIGSHEDAVFVDQWLQVCQERKRAVHEHQTRQRVALEIVASHRNRKILIMSESIAAVDQLWGALRRGGSARVSVYKEHSAMPKFFRNQNVNDFKFHEGARQGVMVSARTLDEGMDFPDVDLVLIHSSSSNVRQFIQRKGRGSRAAGAEDTLIFRPFAIGTSDEIAITNIIKSKALPSHAIKIVDVENNPIEMDITERNQMIRLSLLTNDMIRFENRRQQRAPWGLAKKIRKFKRKGGVFYWDEQTTEVKVNVDGTWHTVGKAHIKIPTEKGSRSGFTSPPPTAEELFGR